MLEKDTSHQLQPEQPQEVVDVMYRTEHSRSLEDTEVYKSLDTLKQLGVLIPVDQIDTFHGRKNDNETWSINPYYSNETTEKGNNVYHRPVLYAAEESVAGEFVQAKYSANAWGAANVDIDEIIKTEDPNVIRDARVKRLQGLYDERLAKNDGKPLYETVYGKPEMSNGLQVRGERTKVEKIRPADYEWETEPEPLTDDEIMLTKRVIHNYPENAPQSIKEKVLERVNQAHLGRIAVHRVTSDDKDASVIDANFNVGALDPDQQTAYFTAVMNLTRNVRGGYAPEFGTKDTLELVQKELLPIFNEKLKAEGWCARFNRDEIKEISDRLGIDQAPVVGAASVLNAKVMAGFKGIKALAFKLLDSTENVVSEGDDAEDVPINLVWAERLFREAHIVGERSSVYSATMKHKKIEVISFFDLHRTNTAEAYAEKRAKDKEQFGAIAEHVDTTGSSPFLDVLKDVYVKPQAVVEAAKKVGDFKKFFEADAGNWEGFTLEEHTETVLRNFDENYADKVPVELLAPMRLAFVAHDLGKPVAAHKGDKHNQVAYNQKYAQQFYDALGFDDKTSNFLLSIIGEGSGLVFQRDVRKRDVDAKLHDFAEQQIANLFGTEPTDADVEGYISLCKMFVTCDGGAYTDMAVTRRGNITFRNAPSFNDTFEKGIGLGRRDLKIKP